VFAVLLGIAGSASSAVYPCPAALSPSAIACTLTSPGGTTTFVVNASAQITGFDGKAGVVLEMTANNVPCNANYDVPLVVSNAAHPDIRTTASINGTCTVDVTSRQPVSIVVVAPSFDIGPLPAPEPPDFKDWHVHAISTTLAANSVAFLPDTFLSVATVGNGTVFSSDSGIGCGSDCTESYSPGTTVTLTAIPGPGATFVGWSGDCAGTAPTCAIGMSQTRNVTAHFSADDSRVVEFHNATLDHYFVTADPNEAALIDNGGAGPGWVRTGLSFKPGGFVPVCRFYGSVVPGPNSHFYTAAAEECNALKTLQALVPASSPRWNYEGTAFATNLPVNGVCPTLSVPVYRAYNNGFALGKDSNHRYAIDPNAIQQVIARGWKFEGVVMCARE
jgi:uncharacterized repeat protein (TIGR02543 family)